MSISPFSAVQFGKRQATEQSSFFDLAPLPSSVAASSSSGERSLLHSSTAPASSRRSVSLLQIPSNPVQITYKPNSANLGLICDRATHAEQAYLMSLLRDPSVCAQIDTFATLQGREITLSGPSRQISLATIGKLFSAMVEIQRKQPRVESIYDKSTGLGLRFAAPHADEPGHLPDLKAFKTIMDKCKELVERSPHCTMVLSKGTSKALVPQMPKGYMLHLSGENFLKLYNALKAYAEKRSFENEEIEFGVSAHVSNPPMDCRRLLSEFAEGCEAYWLSIKPDVQKAIEPKLSSFTSFAREDTVYDLFRSGAFAEERFSSEALSKALVQHKRGDN